MRRTRLSAAVSVFFLFVSSLPLIASDYDELKGKRQEVFEFTQPPKVTRNGDRITIAFASKAYCDATIAIENEENKIVRHLASGVLGPNAPEPFQKNSLAQAIVWDGKNDQGVYMDDKDALAVRVSLGLKPEYEHNLLWSPKKRIGSDAPILCASPDGVYVFEGLGVDHIRFFDHDGNYVRTVYPFPADKVKDVIGLELHTYPQDGKELPVKHGFVQASLLSSGTSYMDDAEKHHGGIGATSMAVCGNRLATAYCFVNRLATDGSTGGLPIKGPSVSFSKRIGDITYTLGPDSAAFSPDGKWLYLTGYHYVQVYPGSAGTWQGVYRLDFAKGVKPEVFAGDMSEGGFGSDDAHFMVPTSVATDAQGRVYVSDFMNDRVQIFSPDGKFLKTIASDKPAKVLVHQRTGEIYVFSWPAKGVSNEVHRRAKKPVDWRNFPCTLTRFGPFENPKRIDAFPLPAGALDGGGMVTFGTLLSVEIDSWAKDPTLWVVSYKHRVTAFEVDYWGAGTIARELSDPWANDGIRVFTLQGGKWELKRNFGQEAGRELVRVKPPDFSRQRLYVNPADEKLYVAEDSGFGKSFNEMLQIDPATGKVKKIPLPFDPEDMCFDQNGLAYLRTDTLVARYNVKTWREVPWDYGEERDHVQFSSIGGGKDCSVVSGLVTPGQRPVCWHQGGMSVSPKGHLAVSCVSRNTAERQKGVKFRQGEIAGKPYVPTLYPGRARWQEIHIWDSHGKPVYEDAAPGLTLLCGTEIDNDDNLYVMADSTRAFDGKKYWNEMTGTVMKFKPGVGKVVSGSGHAPVPITEASRPNRPPEVAGGFTGTAWVNGAEWLFGAAGWFGFNTARAGGGCDCWHSRFCIDYFARSFVPEVERYSVAVLDKNGNVILRVGQYGNVDDGKPLAPLKGAPAGRAIGGDEVALFHAAYVGTHTDRRLFIHDAGNSRIVSVKLNYHASETVALKNVADGAGK